MNDLREKIHNADDDVRKLYMRYLGALGLLSECSVHVDDEMRESIEQAFTDAENYGLKWRRVLERIEIEPGDC